VDPVSGVIVEPPNLGPEFRDIPIAAEMSEAKRQMLRPHADPAP